MKYKIISAMVIFCFIFSTAYAFNGHNGIGFDMSQNEVEAKGFVCNPPNERGANYIAECEHMDMTGVAFGYPTNYYRVRIGKNKKVIMIGAVFSGTITQEDYFKLQNKIEFFFPKKDEKASFYKQGMAIRDEWNDQNNASAVLLYVKGIPPITKTSISITFWSPYYMNKINKN